MNQRGAEPPFFACRRQSALAWLAKGSPIKSYYDVAWLIPFPPLATTYPTLRPAAGQCGAMPMAFNACRADSTAVATSPNPVAINLTLPG